MTIITQLHVLNIITDTEKGETEKDISLTTKNTEERLTLN